MNSEFFRKIRKQQQQQKKNQLSNWLLWWYWICKFVCTRMIDCLMVFKMSKKKNIVIQKYSVCKFSFWKILEYLLNTISIHYHHHHRILKDKLNEFSMFSAIFFLVIHHLNKFTPLTLYFECVCEKIFIFLYGGKNIGVWIAQFANLKLYFMKQKKTLDILDSFSLLAHGWHIDGISQKNF